MEVSSRRRRGGMTLVEVMIASVLLALGLLTMLALQLHAVRGSQVGRHYTFAAQLARDRMEDLQRQDWVDVPITAGWVADVAQTSQVQNQTGGDMTEQTFSREFRVSADPAGLAVIRQVDVRVTWYEPNDPPPPAAPRRRYAVTSFKYNED